MTPFPFYHQHDTMQCGITYLRMICKYYGKEYSIESLSSLHYSYGCVVEWANTRKVILCISDEGPLSENSLKVSVCQADRLVKACEIASRCRWEKGTQIVSTLSNIPQIAFYQKSFGSVDFFGWIQCFERNWNVSRTCLQIYWSILSHSFVTSL